jgi:hypothetical protein
VIAYCQHCRENINYTKDPFHYHEPVISRCQVCGAKCLSGMCAGCRQGLSEPQIEEREMVGTRIKRGSDDE